MSHPLMPLVLERTADLGRGMVEHRGPDKADEFELYRAELKKVDDEIEALMREMLGKENYKEYWRELRRAPRRRD